ncbi:PLP-dependent aminotransferase family protein [Brevibacillus sp. B_LB10_24]|uniref:MocR-like pyridoxine biosynthesis transcription factor PdxR n=1 Tax=Brevibacillus sp. B_LB10_24 TaxID=3380645 RepID=UPI0038BB8E19
MINRSFPEAADTKTKQIYDLLRERILQNRYTAGDRLPSTRDLASEFGVSRSIIVEVYEQLIAEGYLEGRQGSGTYVADLGQERPFQVQLDETVESGDLAELPKNPARFHGIDFRPSFPALEHIPYKKWKETALSIFDRLHTADYGYEEDPAGNGELRANICRFLLQTKGIRCSPRQVVVTAGATQAIDLLCRLLLKPGDAVATEDPTAPFIYQIFASTGAEILPVPVDEHGLRVEALPTAPIPKCVFVTPSHQFPLGSILSIGRRIQLLEFARQTGCYLIEDDYDSEFRYAGMPVRALRELDSERVIYVGTFSKNLFPSLRLGYMVVPQDLLAPLLRLKQLTDIHCPTLPQITLARFIADRHLERHIARMKRIYSRKRKRLIDSLNATFGGGVKITGDAAGLHLIAEFSDRKFDSLAAEQLERRNIKIYPAERYAIVKGKQENRLVMGFGNAAESQIDKGIMAMADLRNAWI